MEDIDHDAPASRHSRTPSILTSASGFTPSPAGHPPRRSVTVGDVPSLRRRPTSMASILSSDAESSASCLRRRGSTLSDFSMADAGRTFRGGTHDILNTSGAKSVASAQGSSWIVTYIPLVFAIFPAMFGACFDGGHAVITDVLLLGLVFVFLRYTITQPWQWYHEAQEVRIRQEVGLEEPFEEGSDDGIPAKMSASMTALDEVPEEDSQGSEDDDRNSHGEPKHHAQREMKHPVEKQSRTRAQQAAVNELYIHEVLALLACFLSPVLGAYLLHIIRASLTRPSEGLMTDFNITVFLLAAELRPISHALKLIQARTLHLQRIVQAVPVARSTAVQLELMRVRLAQLELRADATVEATATAMASAKAAQQEQEQQKQKTGARNGGNKDVTVREVRNTIQPDIDAVTRAVRRYEKKVTIMAVQTAAQLHTMDTRLDDAIALAAAAAKQNGQAQWGLGSLAAWLFNWLVTIVTMPYHLAMYAVIWPFKTVANVCLKGRRSSRDARESSGRSGRHSGFKGARNGSVSDRERYKDRLPSRLSGRYSP